MPIEIMTDEKNGEKYYAYNPPKPEYVESSINDMITSFLEYTKYLKTPPENAQYDADILARIALRVDQRLEYYKIYHNNTHLSEMRVIAVIAYWIVKYRPFSITGWTVPGTGTVNGKVLSTAYTNESVALHMIVSMLKRLKKHKNEEFDMPNELKERINHALREHDLTKESIMLLAESLLY